MPFFSLERFFNYFSGQEVQKRCFDADSKNFEFDPKMGGRLTVWKNAQNPAHKSNSNSSVKYVKKLTINPFKCVHFIIVYVNAFQTQVLIRFFRVSCDFGLFQGRRTVDSFILQRCRQTSRAGCLKRSFGYKNDARKSSRSIPGDLRLAAFCHI